MIEYLEQSPSAARIFGLFYEDLLAIYFQDIKGYEILAGRRTADGSVSRPTVWRPGERKRLLISDFVLRDDSGTYIVEAKCWPGYDSRPLTPDLARRHLKAFLGFHVSEHVCRFADRELQLDGKIIAWWSVDDRSWTAAEKRCWQVKEIVPIRAIWTEPDSATALARSASYQDVLARWQGHCAKLFVALGAPAVGPGMQTGEE